MVQSVRTMSGEIEKIRRSPPSVPIGLAKREMPRAFARVRTHPDLISAMLREFRFIDVEEFSDFVAGFRYRPLGFAVVLVISD